MSSHRAVMKILGRRSTLETLFTHLNAHAKKPAGLTLSPIKAEPPSHGDPDATVTEPLVSFLIRHADQGKADVADDWVLSELTEGAMGRGLTILRLSQTDTEEE